MNSYTKSKKSKRPQSSKAKPPEIMKDPKINPPSLKQENSYLFQKDNFPGNMQYSNLPSVDQNNRSKSLMNDSMDYKIDSLNEEYSILQKIWEDLGVTYKYQVLFDNYIRTVSESKLKNIITNEKNSLKKFGEALLKLSKEITSRENNIHSLQRYIFALVNSGNYFENDEDGRIKRNREDIIMNIISLIKSLRLNSVNVVTHFTKVRELSTYNKLVGKIDMNLINKEYNYDEKYLIKMRTDMNFLNEYPKLSKYFDMNNSEIDAFLTNFSPNSNRNFSYSKINSNKVKIPVNDDLKRAIVNCRYILLQESFFENISSTKEYNNDYMININKNNSSRFNNDSGSKLKMNNSKLKLFKNEDNDVNMVKNEYQNMFNNNNYSNNNICNMEEKEIKKLMEADGGYGMNRSLEFLRKNMGKDYNMLFMSNKDKYVLKNKKINFNNSEYNNLYLNNSKSFRKPFLGNNIIIEREEKKEKKNSEFVLRNVSMNKKESLLGEENQELNRQLDEVCAKNENLNDEIYNLKKYVINLKKKKDEEDRERERIGIKKNKELAKKELENELKYKELDRKKDILIQEKNDLNQKIKETKTLMEKNEEENKQKINQINALMQNQKEDYERKIEGKNNEINNLNNEKEGIINEKNDIIKQKDEVINEKNQLQIEKKDLEDKILQLEQEIEEYKNEMEKYKQLQIDYNNLQNKEIEMQNKIEELNKEINNLNEQIINIKNESQKDKDELIQKINDLEQNCSNLNSIINDKENEKQNLIKEKDDLINKNNNLNNEIKDLNTQINGKDNKIEELEKIISELSEEINILKDRNPDATYQIIGNYKYDFYKENLFNFINSISESLSLDKIPDFIRNTFNLEKINIFEESTYLKGVYPKIITSSLKSAKENGITGMCSLYYENYGDMREPLVLRIEGMCVVEKDWEEQIENMINFIKDKMVFDEIKYIINYVPSPEDGKLRLDKKIKDFFKNKLHCVWKNLTNLSDGSRTQDIRFIKEGNYFDQEENNYFNNNKKLFGFNTLSILSLFDTEEETENILKNNFSLKGYNRYINLFPIFVLLANNPEYKMMFKNKDINEEKIYEIPEEENNDDPNKLENINPKNQIRKISEMFFNIEDINSLKQEIGSLNSLKDINIEDSLFEEINKKLEDKVSRFSFNYLTMNLNLSTTTNYCLEYENYYYNRISSKDIDILRDPETKNLFYLIPTKTENTFILLCQVGRRLQKELLDGHKNIYDTFMEFHPKLTSQLMQFSSLGLVTSEIKNLEKTIYIPSFKIDTHIYSYSTIDINKKGTIINERNGANCTVGSIEEYFNMSFEEDKNIKNSFSIIPVEDNKMNLVIREPFLFGVFNINIISSTPLQLVYVTKDHWIPAKQKK